MLIQRVLVAAILLPLGIAAILAGGLWFALVGLVILCLAVWEYATLFEASGLRPARAVLIGGVAAILAARYLGGHDYDDWLFPLLVLVAMAVHLLAYERGRDQAATDFAVTLSGLFYIGLLGSYLVLLRALPNGEWWMLLALPSLWVADSAAYFLGTRFGRHKLAPRLSPHKSWEGYISGIVFGTLGAPLLLLLYQRWGLPSLPAFNYANAALLGFFMSLLPTLGDLGESMIKRQVGAKDSGTILPGHGGMFDRIDSWLWALPISYYLIVWLFL
jgi:phosphatidate cytidylyltransferase